MSSGLCQVTLSWPLYRNKTWTPYIHDGERCERYLFNNTYLEYTVLWTKDLSAAPNGSFFRDFQIIHEIDLQRCIAECAKYTAQVPSPFNRAQDVCVAVTLDDYDNCWLKKLINSENWPPKDGKHFLPTGFKANGSAIWNWNEGPTGNLDILWT